MLARNYSLRARLDRNFTASASPTNTVNKFLMDGPTESRSDLATRQTSPMRAGTHVNFDGQSANPRTGPTCGDWARVTR
jgi:hypothetical protein